MNVAVAGAHSCDPRRASYLKRDVMQNENPQKNVTVVDSIPIRSILNIQCAL